MLGETESDLLEGSDGWDPLAASSPAHLHWTITNLAEAIPGVTTPLNWWVWGRQCDLATRSVAHRIGAMTGAEVESRDPDARILRAFYGRAALRLEWMAMVGDRMPGTTGRDAIAHAFGEVPEDMTFRATRARYPVIALRLPVAFARYPRELRALVPVQERWWRESVGRVHGLDLDQSLRFLAEADGRFLEAMKVQVTGILSSVQPLYDALVRLVQRTGVGDVGILGGTGGAEMAVVADIWRASRGEIDVEEVVGNHGFHGPYEGELESVVWREDDGPLRRMVERYAARDESHSPLAHEQRRREVARTMERDVLAAVSVAQRPATRLLLKLARERLPTRGVAKRSFLQAIDVARAAARRAGELLAADGVLDAPGDVFYLTGDELQARDFTGAAQRAQQRRRRREAYASVGFASMTWRGLPELVAPERAGQDDAPSHDAEVVVGIGVSSGVVEGTARVVTNPDFSEVEPDEILVAPTTDPSWASIMFISSALVVDIGGAISHAAVVARELEIPCVVSTRDGTKRIRSGDRVRVDGSAGTIEILERAATTPSPGLPDGSPRTDPLGHRDA